MINVLLVLLVVLALLVPGLSCKAKDAPRQSRKAPHAGS